MKNVAFNVISIYFYVYCDVLLIFSSYIFYLFISLAYATLQCFDYYCIFSSIAFISLNNKHIQNVNGVISIRKKRGKRLYLTAMSRNWHPQTQILIYIMYLYAMIRYVHGCMCALANKKTVKFKVKRGKTCVSYKFVMLLNTDATVLFT